MVGCWHGCLSGARCRLAYGPADATATLSLAPVKSRLVLPFWYRLTWVVQDRGTLNGCVCVCVCALVARASHRRPQRQQQLQPDVSPTTRRRRRDDDDKISTVISAIIVRGISHRFRFFASPSRISSLNVCQGKVVSGKRPVGERPVSTSAVCSCRRVDLSLSVRVCVCVCELEMRNFTR